MRVNNYEVDSFIQNGEISSGRIKRSQKFTPNQYQHMFDKISREILKLE